MRTIISQSENQTLLLGEELGRSMKGGEILLLFGDLGAGKTMLTKGIALGLGINDNIKSPTFTLQCQYQGRLTLWHFDVYRLESGDEALGVGIDEYFGDKSGVCVIEWPEKIMSILPSNAKKVEIKTIDLNTKEIKIYD